jgi:hypothetical protein
MEPEIMKGYNLIKGLHVAFLPYRFNAVNIDVAIEAKSMDESYRFWFANEAKGKPTRHSSGIKISFSSPIL